MTKEKSKLMEVSIGMIDRPRESVRMSIPQDEIKELAESIKEQGLLQAIVLNEKDGRYEVVAGDRRFLAYKLLGLKKIEAKVVHMSGKAIALARGAENIQRRDLSAVEEGCIYSNLVDEHKLTIDGISKMMGKSPGVVKRRIGVLQMPGSFQKAVHEKQVSLTVAEELLGCTDPGHREYLIEMAIEHGVTKEVARLWVTDWRKSLHKQRNAGEDGGSERSVMEPEIFYRSCDVCKGPVDLNKVKEIRACPDCFNGIMSALRNGGGNGRE